MARVAQPRARFEIYPDSREDDFAGIHDHSALVNISNNRFAPLRSVATSNCQNLPSKTSPAKPNSAKASPSKSSPAKPSPERSSRKVEALAAELKKLQIAEPHELRRVSGKPIWQDRTKAHAAVRLTRPPISANTFEALETVPEDEKHDPSGSAAISVSDDSQHYIELPADNYLHHPLASAAHYLPSAEEQLAKHCNGEFEWVLKVPIPSNRNSESAASDFEFFGCNLLPNKTSSDTREPLKSSLSHTYALLVTPLEGDADLLEATESVDKNNMDTAEVTNEHATPSLSLAPYAEVRVAEVSPASTILTSEDNSFVENNTSRSPANFLARIEDSVEAIDQLEEELEAFDQAAHIRRVVPPNMRKGSTQAPMQPRAATSARSTPQPNRPCPRTGWATLRVNATEQRQSPSVRRSASMIFLDSPKLKEEDKALVRAPPKKSTGKGLASLQPPRQPAKSTKPPTIPIFSLPGDAVARRLKEQREARLASQVSPEKVPAPAPAGLRRTKSAKPPTRPHFELPGDAISRRKREEREARLKAQEEEERRRREFKAKPIRSGVVPSSVPRETITSRARQGKAPLVENQVQQASPSPNKRQSMVVASRDPLTNTYNLQPRGRNLTTDTLSATQLSRATSSSTGSISGKRSSVSVEDVQQQRLRGKDIYQRDSLFVQDRNQEQREREALARAAREQAAERSRKLSREWAEKQGQKRTTFGSVRGIIA